MSAPSRFAPILSVSLAIALMVCGGGCSSGQPASAEGPTAQAEDVLPTGTGEKMEATEPDVASDALIGTVWLSPEESDPDDFGFYLEFPSQDHCYLMWVYGGGVTGVEGAVYQLDGTNLVTDGRFSGSVSASLDMITLSLPDGTTRAFMPDDRQLTSQQDFVNMMTYLDPIWNADGTRFRRIETDAATDNAASTTDEPQMVEDEVVSSSCVVVVTPREWANKGLTWIVNTDGMNLEYAHQGNRELIACIDWSERAETPYEVAEERWTLGEGTIDGEMRKVVLHISYVDKNGKVFHANADTKREVLAPEYYLSLSPEEILSWIETGGVESDLSATTEGLSKRTSEFCGIWAFASKDLREAVTFSNEARQRGFAAEVFLTTNWSNLNDEPWYVVSLGCAYSEDEANRVLLSARNSIYGDAYIKWTGNYVG